MAFNFLKEAFSPMIKPSLTREASKDSNNSSSTPTVPTSQTLIPISSTDTPTPPMPNTPSQSSSFFQLPSSWQQLLPIFSPSSSDALQKKSLGEASNFYQLHNLPIDPIPVNAGASVVNLQESCLDSITSNHDILYKKAAHLDRQWPLITAKARKTNLLVAGFEQQVRAIPTLVSHVESLKRKTEQAFVMVQSLERLLTALEVAKNSREMNQWKEGKKQELHQYKVKATGQIQQLETQKKTLERTFLARVTPAPSKKSGSFLDEIAASIFFTPQSQF